MPRVSVLPTGPPVQYVDTTRELPDGRPARYPEGPFKEGGNKERDVAAFAALVLKVKNAAEERLGAGRSADPAKIAAAAGLHADEGGRQVRKLFDGTAAPSLWVLIRVANWANVELSVVEHADRLSPADVAARLDGVARLLDRDVDLEALLDKVERLVAAEQTLLSLQKRMDAAAQRRGGRPPAGGASST